MKRSCFNEGLPDVCEQLAKLRRYSRDYCRTGYGFFGRPFGPMPALLAKAEYIELRCMLFEVLRRIG